MARRGRISEWNDERGFGFITATDGAGRVFAHISAFSDRTRRPALADFVSYELGADARGRPRASNVTYIGASGARGSGRPWPVVRGVVAGVMLAGIGVLAYNRGIFIEVLFFYLVASTITFLMYAFDKSAAMKQAWRIAENTLHVLSMVGGWPGALAGQRLLRHKSRKTSFQVSRRPAWKASCW